MSEGVKNDDQVRRELVSRMSLRLPQERSLDILADILKGIPLA